MKRDTEIPHLAALRDTRLLTPWAGLRTCEQGGVILPLSSAFPWFTQWHVAGPTNSLTVAWAASALPANGKRTDFPFHSARWLSGGAPKALLRTYNKHTTVQAYLCVRVLTNKKCCLVAYLRFWFLDKARKTLNQFVIPAKAGIHVLQRKMDPRCSLPSNACAGAGKTLVHRLPSAKP